MQTLFYVICAIVVLIFIALAVISLVVIKKPDLTVEKKYVKSVLPLDVDCGKCGCNTCDEFADKVVANKDTVYACPLVSEENKKEVFSYFQTSQENSTKVAFVACKGGIRCDNVYDYKGVISCKLMEKRNGGNKACLFACLGCGDCQAVCPTRAISINDKHVAEIDPFKCIGCGNCVKTCPKKVIRMIPTTQNVAIVCSSSHNSTDCSVGCSACGLCVANCPQSAIKIIDDNPIVDSSKCTSCLKCVRICPNHTISRV